MFQAYCAQHPSLRHLIFLRKLTGIVLFYNVKFFDISPTFDGIYCSKASTNFRLLSFKDAQLKESMFFISRRSRHGEKAYGSFFSDLPDPKTEVSNPNTLSPSPRC